MSALSFPSHIPIPLLSFRFSAATCIVLTVLPLIKTGAWYVRCWDFPRLQLALASGLLAAATLAALAASGFHLETARELELAAWAVLLMLGAAWQTAHVVQFTSLWRCQTPELDETSGGINLVVANLKHDNRRHGQALNTLSRLNADLLALVEVDQAWSNALTCLHDAYPHRHEEIIEEGLGMALYSKLPLQDVTTRFLIEPDRPSIWARVTTARGTHQLICVHPTPPGLPEGDERRDSRVRDAELVTIAKALAAAPAGHSVVAGDFNDVAWSHTTRLFKRLSGLKDPRIGRSFMGTYHAHFSLLRFPIDHAFFSDGFAVTALARHTIPGSDHLAISLRYRLVNQSQTLTPEPEVSDRAEAGDLLREGHADAKDTVKARY